MKYTSLIIRYLLGAVFLFSGFVKMVDPLGTAYKIEEYFKIWDLLALESWVVPLSFLLVILEFLLGMALILRFQIKKTLWVFLGINLLFLWLTGYSAFTGKVKDCGCFGDAIKLDNWETFYKNIVLTMLTILLFPLSKSADDQGKSRLKNSVMRLSLLICLLISGYAVRYLPIIDFRPFAVGKSIQEGIKAGKIHDFYIEANDDGTDITESLLKAPKVLLMVTETLEKASKEGLKNAREIIRKAKAQNFQVIALSASSVEACHQYEKQFHLPPFYFCDGTTLKTMIRGSLGWMVLKNGIVQKKASWRNGTSILKE